MICKIRSLLVKFKSPFKHCEINLFGLNFKSYLTKPIFSEFILLTYDYFK